jgi:Ca2+-binding EF-hand superfamily protein
MIANIDTDNSGFVEFDEFIMAAINKSKLYTKENLAEAFRAFD